MVFSKKGCRRSKIVLDFLCKESYDLRDFVALVSYLRSPNGCPWDQVQTHESIRKNMVEEAYELVDAIDSKDDGKIVEEAGDVLMQAVFHAQLGEDRGAFDCADVTSGVCEKLIFRHSHIFGGDDAKNADDALSGWYNRRSFSIACEREYDELSYSRDLLDAVKAGYEFLIPYYEYFDKSYRMAD